MVWSRPYSLSIVGSTTGVLRPVMICIYFKFIFQDVLDRWPCVLVQFSVHWTAWYMSNTDSPECDAMRGCRRVYGKYNGERFDNAPWAVMLR